MKKYTRIISLVLALVMCITAIPFLEGMTVSAASVKAFDRLSSSSYAKVYALSTSGKTIPYTSSSLSTRGTVSYGASKSSYIANSTDEMYLMDVGKNSSGTYWGLVSYPTNKGRVKAYIYLSAITSNNGSHARTISSGKFNCARRKGASESPSYYVAKNDEVYLIATSGSNCQILYPTGSTWRIAWCSASNYNKYCVPKKSYNPTGCVDSVSSSAANKVSVSGWAFDKDSTSTSIDIRVYVGGPSGSGYGVNIGKASVYRSDVNKAYGCGNYHGFSSTFTVPTKYAGTTQPVYIYAINVGGGSNVLLGTKSVYIKPTATTGTSSVTSSKIKFSYSSTKTNYTTSGSSKLVVNGTTVKVGSTFYTYNSKGTKKTIKTNSGYTYAKIGSKFKNVNGWQCCGFARYIQCLLYGTHDFSSSKFTKLSSASGKKATASTIKSWVQKAGVGCHIRSSRPHSLVVIGYNSKGFYYTDANFNGKNTIRVGYYTWSDFANCKYSKINYISYYKG